MSALYRSLVGGGVDLYRNAAEVYGHAEALLTKVYWDNFAYWSYPCQLYMQELYRLTGDEMMAISAVGQRFAELTKYMQCLFGAWAELKPSTHKPGFRGMPGFPSVLIDAHLALQNKWSPSETFDYISMRLCQAEEIAGEILIRVMDEVGEELAEELVERADVWNWGIRISDKRVSANDTIGLARRRALPNLARDVERTMGKPAKNIDETIIRRILARIIDAPDTSAEVEKAEGDSASARAQS